MHCKELGNGHSPQGSKACSLGIFFTFTCSKINSSAFWQHICSNSTYVQTVRISTFGTQQYWIAEIELGTIE